MVDYCERDNEPSSSGKGRDFLTSYTANRLFKSDSVP
jgi:hypothetical protein